MTEEPWRAKTREIFAELVAETAGQNWADGFKCLTGAIEPALIADEIDEQVAKDIAFHLSDWCDDARFLVALQLFPDRFTQEEISSGVMAFLIHAPNHVATAAKLYGFPVEDIFDDPRTDTYISTEQ